MKQTLLTLIIVFLTQILFSQNDFRSGFVIRQNGDTTSGFLDYREGTASFHSCSFKDPGVSRVINFTAEDIRGYGFVKDKYFESRKIDNGKQGVKPVFLEVLVKGRVSLYRDENNFYTQKGDSELYKLTNEKYETVVNGTTYMQSTNRYIGLLKVIMSDCDDIKSQITRAGLKERSLTKLVIDYNTLMGASFSVSKFRKPWIKLSVAISGGTVFSWLKFTETKPGFNYLEDSFSVSTSPVFDLSVNILSPRLNERFSFQGGLIFYNTKYYSYNINKGAMSTERNYTTIESGELKFPFGGRYTMPGRKIVPFVQGGPFITLNIKPSADRATEVQSNYTIDTYHPEMFKIAKIQWGFWIGTGLEKRLSKRMIGFLELKLDHSFGLISWFLSSAAPFQSRINCFQIGLGIKMH